MSDELNTQLSAFVDDELTPEESELLVRRLCRDESLRHTAASYAIIGDVLRGEPAVTAPADFADRVMMAVEGQAVPAARPSPPSQAPAGRQWGIAIAASAILAVVALMTLPDRSTDEAPVHFADTGAGAPVVVADDSVPVPALETAVGPGSFDVPYVPVDRQSPQNRARLNDYLLYHVNAGGMTRQGLAPYRNIGMVYTSSERR